jgi:tetratricopeptide (TPR) repeat protein
VPPQAAQQYAAALKLMKAGQATDAELEFKHLAAIYPEFAGPQLNLGLLYLQGSRLPDAEAAFKAVLEHNPSNAIAGNELGIVERRLGKFTEAEAAYRRAIAVEPNYAPAYLNLGVLYDLYLAEPQKALDQFEHYIQLAGENKQVAGWVVELRKRVAAPPSASKKEPACNRGYGRRRPRSGAGAASGDPDARCEGIDPIEIDGADRCRRTASQHLAAGAQRRFEHAECGLRSRYGGRRNTRRRQTGRRHPARRSRAQGRPEAAGGRGSAGIEYGNRDRRARTAEGHVHRAVEELGYRRSLGQAHEQPPG